ncbi:MAG: toll/interleukin-1 receptor domain-containing protein [Acidobacteriota bacterium]|nr:toll/interleukin-1 receptor domain-containing protein [Acidobacteriota bacterium]
MAYVPGFEYDIFISYAHVDNSEFSDHWVDHFQKWLQGLVDSNHGRPGRVRIWRDTRDMGAGRIIDDTVEHGLNNSAVMVALLSRGYVTSDYCLKEWNMFQEIIGRDAYGSRIDTWSRQFPVMLRNLPPEQWPPNAGEKMFVSMHDAVHPEKLGNPLEIGSPPFREAMSNLSENLWFMLEAFKQRADAKAAEPQPAPASESESTGPKIFLARANDTLHETFHHLKDGLEHEGIRIVTDIPPPHEDRAHEERVIQELADCDLSIHLMDHLPGRAVEGNPETTYAHAQLHLAEGKTHRLIWTPADLDIAAVGNPVQRDLLTRLESGERERGDYSFVQGSPANLTREVMDLLRDLQSSDAPGEHSLLLDTHLKDLYCVSKISDRLLEGKVDPLLVNPETGEPEQNLDILESRLRSTARLLVFNGRAPNNWAVNRLAEAFRLVVSCSLQARDFLMYLAPPRKDPGAIKRRLHPLPVRVWDNSDSDTPKEGLLDFIFNGGDPA